MSWLFGTAKKEQPALPNVVPQTPSQQSFKAMSNAFRKGVQYNMKIVLRGDVMTGKSNLFHRLQGADFDENYTSTPQIEVANIPWHYKDSNDIVKIEIWDVVDKAHNKTKSTADQGIKLEHKSSSHTTEREATAPSPPIRAKSTDSAAEKDPNADGVMGLDATTVNVYRNAHGAIFLFDTTKPWTFDYVNNELEKVPESMAVLVLGNFCDKTQERKVELDTIHATLYQHNQDRIKRGAIKPDLIRYAESSMQSGLGLKYIYEYLGVPFLQLMIESLNKQLELKAVEIVDLLEVLDTDDDVPETMQRRRAQDNFNQPSEPRLARQQEEMKSAWYDEELQEIAQDHHQSFELETTPDFTRPETPPPPTKPVKSKKSKKNKPLIEPEPEIIPVAPITTEFGGAEEVEDTLADDWFGEEDATPTINLPVFKANDSDDELGRPGNPMVAGDEDVEEPAIYYHKHNIVKKESEDEQQSNQQVYIDQQEEEEEEEVTHRQPEVYHPPVFKSELNDVWSRGLRRLSGPEIISDSEDEDNKRQSYIDMDSPSASSPSNFMMDSSPSYFGTEVVGGYEEISGSNEENPWSIGHHAQPAKVREVEVQHSWNTQDNNDDHFQKQAEEEEVAHQPADEEKEIIETPAVATPLKKKKSFSSKKKSSSSGKKKKSSSSK